VPTVVVAPALARWLNPAPDINVGEKSVAVTGSTVRDVLDALFTEFPVLRGYVVDERGALRHHVVAFLNGSAVTDKTSLSEAVDEDGELYLFQA
jgi:molybdopterin synthase sulfur carrier subunit